jgi:hypothetical protein
VVTVNEDSRADRWKQQAQSEAERAKQQVDQKIKDPMLQKETIRQDNLIYGGLVGIGIVMVQPFLITESLNRSAMIAVVAWSVAIPLLAALLLVNRHETFRGRRTPSRIVAAARSLAMLFGLVGLVAGFWHIHWIAGAGVLAGSLVATGVHSAGFTRLEFASWPVEQEVNEEPSDSEEPEY